MQIKVHYSHLMHLTNPSNIKQKSLCECGFSRVNMGRDTNISDFWHILLSKKGDTVTNVYSHAYWTNWQWFSMVCILINNNYPLSQWSTFAADSCSPVRWVSKKFWALWWQTSLPIRLQTTLSHYQFVFQLMQAVLPVLLSTTKIGQSDCNITADWGKKF